MPYVDHPECVSGFFDIAAVRYIMAATEVTSHPGELLRYFGKLHFTCNKTNIIRWTLGAKTVGAHQKSTSQIFINKPDTRTTSHTIVLSSLNATSHVNVYEYELSPVTVDQKQHINVLSSHIYYQRCRRSTGSCPDRPLVAVDASKFKLVLHIYYIQCTCFEHR